MLGAAHQPGPSSMESVLVGAVARAAARISERSPYSVTFSTLLPTAVPVSWH